MKSGPLPFVELQAKVQKTLSDPVDRKNYDVIVLGVGSMGAPTCYQLAKKGYKVLGLEQFDIPHRQGSHSGQSRIIRKAYGEGSGYVPLLEKAYENWRELESETGAQLYFNTGLVYLGASNDPFLDSVKLSSTTYNIPVQQLTAEALGDKYPQFKVTEEFQRLEEPDAGLLSPERSILLFVEQAIRRGAVIRTKEKVIDWKYEESTITVKTNSGAYHAKKLVITAGAWATKIIPGFAHKLKVTRQILAWVKPKKMDDFGLGKFPCWLLKNNDLNFYGFPILPNKTFGGPQGLKLGLHYPRDMVTDPDAVNRNITKSEENVLIQFLNEFIPDGFEKILEMRTCLYTNSPDDNFILDFLPGYDKDVAIATGFSGHGFKFASVIGEIMAELVTTGTTHLPIDFLKAQRFGA